MIPGWAPGIMKTARDTMQAKTFQKLGVNLPRLISLFLAAGLFACAPTQKDAKPEVDRPPAAITVSESRGLPTSGLYRGLAVADVNNDGYPDIIGGASQPGTISIWPGRGEKGPSTVINIRVKGDVQSVAAGDFDNDGWQDIAYSVHKEASGIAVLRNLGGESWDPVAGPTETGVYQGIRAVDINRDGNVDILAASRTSADQGGVQVWLGDGKGSWPVEAGPVSDGEYIDAVSADFNGDGHLDIVGAGWRNNQLLRLWFGNGSGGWTFGRSLGEGSWYALTAGDADGDGNTDILAGSYRNGIGVFLGDGHGNFTRSPAVVEGSYWKVIALDLDGDGKKELLAGSLDAAGIRMLQKKYPEKPYIVSESPFPDRGLFYDMAVADLDGDGFEDVCAASFGEGVKFWMGGDGAFSVRTGDIDSFKSGLSEEAEGGVEENDVFTTKFGYPEYRLDSGDTITITFWRGAEKTEEEIVIQQDGTISFGYVEDISVRGLTATELDRILTRRLEEYIRHPRIDVVVKEYNSKFVTILGAVGQRTGTGPGRYKLTGKARVSEMLSVAGGPKDNANLRDVRVRRAKNNQSFTVNLYKAITMGDLSQDVVLNTGDVVFVPSLSTQSNRVYVFGEVDKPGAYTFEGSQMRVFDAVAKAGGYTVFGKPALTRIVRGDITHPEVIDLDLRALVEEGDYSQNIELANGDLVYIPRSGWGDANQFFKRIVPLMRLVLFPAQVVNEYGSASDTLGSPFTRD